MKSLFRYSAAFYITALTSILILTSIRATAQKLTDEVDVFLGTGGHGHTYPGATIPFGMVQLSPDNGVSEWDWCSGYHYSSDSIAGFSHTHLSGTGIGDWCDISVMPFLKQQSVKAAFSHANESGRPGYYQVLLQNGIKAQLTATERCGYHQYTFPDNEGWLQFDMAFAINWDKMVAAQIIQKDAYTIMGYRQSTGWAKNQKVFFAATFSSPISDKTFLDKAGYNTPADSCVKMQLKFNTANKPLLVKVAISSVSSEAALLAIHHEIGNKTFDQVKNNADAAWQKELSKIKISAPKPLRQKFYTALYRTCLAPTVYSDTDGQYRHHSGKLKQAIGKKYTVFSLWDTFRALHTLFTFTQTERLPDMMNSLLSFYDDNGLLPVWDLSTWETNTMTGYHAIPVLADVILKGGIRDIYINKAYEAMKKSAYQKQRGTQDYARFGYLPQDKHGWSVTITLEYAFDDWCIAQVAKKLGRWDDYRHFIKRSNSYKNLFDKSTGFMRAKDSTGKFIEPFDPYWSEHGFKGQYIEGTAWQHSFFVPHDVEGLAKLYGGRQKLVNKLDSLFSTSSKINGTDISGDITGLIGQYAHGNEPSHHIAYMYTALNEPIKTISRIRMIADSMYKSGPDGLQGNDDCGQMSAWYIFSCLGMYPMNPASGEYIFGFPLVDKAIMQLPNGKTFTISRRGGNQKQVTQASVKINGKLLAYRSISHKSILAGGQLVFSFN